jgi:hypothetical protein
MEYDMKIHWMIVYCILNKIKQKLTDRIHSKFHKYFQDEYLMIRDKTIQLILEEKK